MASSQMDIGRVYIMNTDETLLISYKVLSCGYLPNLQLIFSSQDGAAVSLCFTRRTSL